MFRRKQRHIRQPAGMRDDFHLIGHTARVIGDPHGLVRRVQPRDQLRVRRGHPRRAVAGAAFHRLDAAQAEHETPRRGHKIRPHAERPGHLVRRDEFAGRDDADALPQPMLVA